MDEVWKRLTQGRNPEQRELIPGDKEGARLYLNFLDCTDKHKYTVFYGVGAVTIPWSYYRKSVGPFVIGVILSLLPDLLYANYRCDEEFKAYQRHCDALGAVIRQRQAQQAQQQQAAQQAQQAAGRKG
ncbi:hypothetical protein HYH03_000489 [Edaphochlamys debaryana]|uniref:Uncharacterized protein n=1 Tax=Edaphochlamys debaryana TaxID=47281 RepID=A0A835YFY0_9CHLO|nr:hypothetical protein HYH03_000489 [Edaphochlamys debaryana]|eukprot:KAG2501993.1 hypothetical protein HYH03_000489 [Edaphochlamys debaryana]